MSIRFVANVAELLDALRDAQDGETIVLGEGEYSGSFSITQNNLTLAGAGPGLTTLRGALRGLDQVQGFLIRNLDYDPTAFTLSGAETDVLTSGTDNAGWREDRAALAALSITTDPLDPADSVLSFTTNGSGETDGFRAYQGAKYEPSAGVPWNIDLGSGATLTYRFFADPAFADDGKIEKSGVWLGFQNAEGTVGAGGWYSILEYVDADGAAALHSNDVHGNPFTGGFRVWVEGVDGNGEWVAINHDASGWVNVAIEIAPGAAEIRFNVDGETIYTANESSPVWGAGDLNIAQLSTVTVNSRNDSGDSTTYLYDDLALTSDSSGRAVYSDGWRLDYADGHWFVSNGEQTVTLENVDKVEVAGTVYVLAHGGAFDTIQDALAAASAGDTVAIAAGSYSENVSLGKFVHLQGVGGEVTLQGTGTGSGLAIGAGASGTEAEPLVIANLSVTGFLYGLSLSNVSHLSLTGVNASGNNVGLKIGSSVSVDHLAIADSHFDNNSVGWYSDKSATGDSHVSHVTITNTTFNGNSTKGLYTEKLSDATFDHVTVRGSGFDSGYAYNAGFDINLKYGEYQNISIIDSTFDGSGIDGSGPGTALKIAARGNEGDSPAYTSDPASLEGLTLQNVTISGGGSTGLALSNVHDVTSSGNTIEGAVVLAGTDDDDVLVGTAAGDVLQGGAGADTIAGGAGDDYLDGGSGQDTAVFSGNVADYTIEADRVSGGWKVFDNREGSPDGGDSVHNVEILQFADGAVDASTLDVPATLVVDASGHGDFTSIQAALDAAQAGDRIVVKAGVYSAFSVDKGVTIEGEEGAVIHGSFLEDNQIPAGTNVDEWLQTAKSCNASSGAGILVDAADVTIQGLKIEGFYQGVRFAGGPEVLSGITLNGLDITNVVTGMANTYGQGSTLTSVIDGLDIRNLSISHGYHGIELQNPSNAGGRVSGLTLDGAHFENLLEKGIYAELLSNSTLRNLEMHNVGQFGRAAPFGTLGQSGNGIDLNLKWGEFGNIVIEDFSFTDVGLSSGSGSAHAGGGAIAIKAREDGAYASDPAHYTGVLVVRNGEIDGTSTGIRVGEPGVDGLSGVPVQVENVSVTDHLSSGDFGAFDNRTDETLTVTGSASEIDTAASSRNVVIAGADADEMLAGGRGDDVLTGGEGADTLMGGDGNDTLEGGSGNDTLNGGEGTDVAVFSGNVSDYTVEYNRATGVYTVIDNRSGSPDGTDTLTDVELVRFGDGEPVELTSLRQPGAIIVDAAGNGDFTSLQAAIDAALEGDRILVRAGTYAELKSEGGTNFGLVIDKSVTIIGVSGPGDVPITNAQAVAATIISRAESGFGTNFLVTAQNVSIQGLRFEAVASSADSSLPAGAINKAFEIVAGGFSLEHSVVAPAEDYTFSGATSAALYFGDEGADDLESFRVHGNVLGGGITITNGAGDSADADFVITNNIVSGTHFLRVRGEVDGIAWLTEHAGLPGTVTGNNLSGVTGFILQSWDEDASNLADAGFVRDLLANNVTGPYAYVTTADGTVRTVDHTEYGGTAPAVIVERDPAAALENAQSSDTLVIRGNGADAGDLTVEVDNLTVDVSNAGHLDVTLAEGVSSIALAGRGNVDVVGNALDNTFTGNEGNNRIDGGAGTDTLVLQHDQAQYVFTFNPADRTYTVSGPEGTDVLSNVEFVRFGSGDPVAVQDLRAPATWSVGEGGDFATVAEALQACRDGDTIVLKAGEHAGGFTVERDVTIMGAPGASIVGTGTGTGITIAASGVTVTGLAISGFTTAVGFAQTGQMLTDLQLDRLDIHDVRYGAAALNALGGPSKSAAQVDGLSIVDVTISRAEMGILYEIAPSGTFAHVTMDGVSFTDIVSKGIYVEALSDSVIRNITMANVGQGAGEVPRNGIDINLKYGTYSGIVIEDFVFTNVGGISVAGDAAIAVKARDDGSYAAAYTGELIIRNGTIDGTGTGIQVGEPGKNNAGPEVVTIDGVKVSDYLTTGKFGAFNNLSGGTVTVSHVGATVDTGASSQDIQIVGSPGNDTLSGTRGTDTLLGGDGNDSLNGGDGDDKLYGGNGKDLLSGGAGNDTLEGGAGDDTLRGGDGEDVLLGGLGNDTLEGGADNDVLDGGEGDDILRGGSGDDSLTGSAGNDTIDGGEGTDTVHFGGALSEYGIRFQGNTVVVTHKNGGADGVDILTNVETLQFASESLDLTAAIRVFDAQGELKALYDDLASALAAAADGDVIELRPGTHTLDIGAGFDGHLDKSVVLKGVNAGVAGSAARGAESVIELSGGALEVLAANVKIDGITLVGSLHVEAGADGFTLRNSILSSEGTALQIVGVDNAAISGNSFSADIGIGAQSFGTLAISGNRFETVEAGVRLEAGNGAENAQITGNTFQGGQYGVSLAGDSGAYDDAIAINVSGNTFLQQTGAGVHAEGPLPSSLDSSLGTSLPLNLYGTSPENLPAVSVDVTFNSEGNDLIVGGGGNDMLDGTAGNDVIRAGGGDDTITGGLGDDVLYGGAGTDTAVFSGTQDDYIFGRASDGAITVTAKGSATDGADRLYGIERLQFAGDGRIVDISDPSLELASLDIHVDPAQGGEALQNALEALVLEGDTVTFGAGDYDGAQAAISNSSSSIAFDGAQNMGLQVADDAGVAQLTISGDGSVNVTGNSSGLVLNASDYTGSGTYTGGDGDDMIEGGSGNETFVLSHGGGHNVIDGGGGDNQIALTSAVSGVVVDLDAGVPLSSDFADAWSNGNSTLRERLAGYIGGRYGIEYHASETDPKSSALLFGITGVVGSQYDDVLIGADSGTVFDGEGGNDLIVGKAGYDVAVFGGKASEYEITRVDAETVDTQNAAIAGRLAALNMEADGFDSTIPVYRIRYVGNDPQLSTDSFVQVETLRFTGDASTVEYTLGEDGNGYYLQLADGGVEYSAGLSVIGDDYVKGGGGNDRIAGGDGDDRLLGGEGDDTLVGGAGSDYLDGGVGSDTYEIAPSDVHATDVDTIADSGASGVDRIVITESGAIDLSGFTIAGIERLEFSDEGNEITLTSDSADAVAVIGGALSDALNVAFSDDGVTTLNVTGVEALNLYTHGANEADVSAVSGTSLNVTAGTGSDVLTLTGVSIDVDAADYLGVLHVFGAEGARLSVSTGARATEIQSDSGTVAVAAAKLTDGVALTLLGSSAYTVTGLIGDLDASGSTGELVVTTGNNGIDDLVRITAGAGATTITGGGANDQIELNAAALLEENTLTLKGASAVTVTGAASDVDASTLSGALDVTVADAADDAVTIATGSANTAVSGAGADDVVTIDASNLSAGSTLSLAGAAAFTVTGLAGNLAASEASGDVTVTASGSGGQQLEGGSGNDSLTGGAGADRLTGGAGNDFLDGSGGGDILIGGEGDDLLYGGDDTVTDYLVGGAGTDYAIFTGSRADYTIESTTTTVDGQPNVAVVKVINNADNSFDYVQSDVEWLVFTDDVSDYRGSGTYNDKVALKDLHTGVHVLDGNGNEVGAFHSLADAIAGAQDGYRIEIEDDTDLTSQGSVVITHDNLTIVGSDTVKISGLTLGAGVSSLRLEGSFSTTIEGNAEANYIIGNDGNNVIHGGGGDDVIDLRGTHGANTVDGGEGDDTILDGSGKDVLMGGAGNDLIVTTGGADVLVGGSGDDRIVLGTTDGSHVVVQGGSGRDQFVVDTFQGAGAIDLDAVISDFRQGDDTVDLSHLRNGDGSLLSRDDLGLVASRSADIDLGSLLQVTEGDPVAVDGNLRLDMINGLRLTADDFGFDPMQAGDWQQLLLG